LWSYVPLDTKQDEGILEHWHVIVNNTAMLKKSRPSRERRQQVDGKRSFHTWRQLEYTGHPQCVHDGRLALTELHSRVIV